MVEVVSAEPRIVAEAEALAITYVPPDGIIADAGNVIVPLELDGTRLPLLKRIIE